MKDIDNATNLRRILFGGFIAAAILIAFGLYERNKTAPKKADMPTNPIVALV